jgi:hypothetical protein
MRFLESGTLAKTTNFLCGSWLACDDGLIIDIVGD